ncbi:MAG: restriction endonuclease [Proteobacteria bacterium]|nr:restriction endonuclease [Pseudomonadota bacterium]
MRHGHLSEYFADFAVKRLSAVEADRHRSNQHEFDGVSGLRAMLGDEDRRNIPAVFIYLNDDDPDPLREEGFLSWYDARRRHPTRTEWRLYFPDTVVSDNAAEGDLLIIARRTDGSLMVIVAEGGSTIASQLLWLFGAGQATLPGFSVKGELEADQMRLEFASRYILDQIGVVVEETDENHLDQMLQLFGGGFPTTREFSDYARSTLRDFDLAADPDAAIVALMEREEILFRTLERHIIGDRLQAGFREVDDFLKFSLSVQNRRKSRAGSALENHLEHLFRLLGIIGDRTPVTEGKAKPDFLFPGTAQYQDPSFPQELLTMLGAKSTCKDRWRQVLAEADRIPEKHLLTLEPSISVNQTDEMQQRRLQLVLPRGIHGTYAPEQQRWLMTLGGLTETLLDRQKRAGF